jgi:hypothetical protein
MQDSKIVHPAPGTTLFARTRSLEQRRRSLVELTSQSRRMTLASQALSNVLTKTVVSAHIVRPVNATPRLPDFYTALRALVLVPQSRLLQQGELWLT